MNLWIRSQNKEIFGNFNDIAIKELSEDNRNIRGYEIVGYFDKNTEYETLAFYTDKKRAVEVLNEIQETLCLDEFNYENKDKKSYQDCYRYKNNIIAIYEMPKE